MINIRQHNNETSISLVEGKWRAVTDQSMDTYFAHPQGTGLLPLMLRYADSKWAVFERRPEFRTVAYQPGKAAEAGQYIQQMYRIPIPWSIYALQFNAAGVLTSAWFFVRQRPLQSLDDPVFTLPLCNLYDDGRICLPNGFRARNRTNAFAAVYRAMWQGGFNADLEQTLRRCELRGRPAPLMERARRGLRAGYVLTMDQVLSAWEHFDLNDVVDWDYPTMATRPENLRDLLETDKHVPSAREAVFLLYNNLEEVYRATVR